MYTPLTQVPESQAHVRHDHMTLQGGDPVSSGVLYHLHNGIRTPWK